VKDGLRSGLKDGNGGVWGLRNEGRKADPNDVTGFTFDGAFEKDAVFVRGPLKNTQADAKAGEVIGRGQVANLEDFAINEVGDFGTAGRNGEAAFVTVKSSDFSVVLRQEVEALKARRAGHGAITLDGNGGVGARNADGVDEGAAFKGGPGRASGDVAITEGKEHTRLESFGEVDDGVAVEEKSSVRTVTNDAVAFAKMQFVAGVVEGQGDHGVFGAVGFVIDGGGEELGEDEMAVGRPVEGVGGVGKEFVAASVFGAFEKAALLAVGFHEPDVVVLEVEFFGFDVAADAVDDAAVRGKAEGGDLFVDGLERLVEILGVGGEREEKRFNTEDTEEKSTEDVEKRVAPRSSVKTLRGSGQARGHDRIGARGKQREWRVARLGRKRPRDHGVGWLAV
jgi:hypothetical protein